MLETRQELLRAAQDIATDYRQQGYEITLRQLFYRCVATALIPNTQPDYKRLGDIIGQARLAGDFPLDLLVDRTRTVGASAQKECKLDVRAGLEEARQIVGNIPYWTVMADRWFGQSVHLSVWCEKEALASVFEKPCDEAKVGLFCCKSYPSHTSLWQWIKHLRAAVDVAGVDLADDEGTAVAVPAVAEARILYFGDHDPDGWQIPRSAMDIVHRLIELAPFGEELPPVRLTRVALNRDQIDRYAPPPFPARETSSRYASYVREHGIDDAWELDSLGPEVLDRLIRTNIALYFDQEVRDTWSAWIRRNRGRLVATMKTPEWLDDTLRALD